MEKIIDINVNEINSIPQVRIALFELIKALEGYSPGTDKADKVVNATNGNLAGLDASGNLTDSGIAANEVVKSTSVRTIVVLTQAQYDALTTKDANTEYNIIESV